MRIGVSVRVNPQAIRRGNKALVNWKRQQRKKHGFFYNLFHGYF